MVKLLLTIKLAFIAICDFMYIAGELSALLTKQHI